MKNNTKRHIFALLTLTALLGGCSSETNNPSTNTNTPSTSQQESPADEPAPLIAEKTSLPDGEHALIFYTDKLTEEEGIWTAEADLLRYDIKTEEELLAYQVGDFCSIPINYSFGYYDNLVEGEPIEITGIEQDDSNFSFFFEDNTDYPLLSYRLIEDEWYFIETMYGSKKEIYDQTISLQFTDDTKIVDWLHPNVGHENIHDSYLDYFSDGNEKSGIVLVATIQDGYVTEITQRYVS